MKKLLPLFLGITFMLTGCEKNDCTPAKISGSFAKGRTIVIYNHEHLQIKNYFVEEGEHMVFRYEHRYPDCGLTDSKWGEVLNFEVDKDATQFRFEGNELSAAKSYFWAHNDGMGSGSIYELSGGVIEGTKISDNKWRVKAAVTTISYNNEQPRKISFNRDFVIKE